MRVDGSLLRHTHTHASLPVHSARSLRKLNNLQYAAGISEPITDSWAKTVSLCACVSVLREWFIDKCMG